MIFYCQNVDSEFVAKKRDEKRGDKK